MIQQGEGSELNKWRKNGYFESLPLKAVKIQWTGMSLALKCKEAIGLWNIYIKLDLLIREWRNLAKSFRSLTSTESWRIKPKFQSKWIARSSENRCESKRRRKLIFFACCAFWDDVNSPRYWLTLNVVSRYKDKCVNRDVNHSKILNSMNNSIYQDLVVIIGIRARFLVIGDKCKCVYQASSDSLYSL